jgi:HK97 family phage major capsid protein
MKKFLKDLIERKSNEMTELKAKSDASQDLAEVRAIGETLAALKVEIEEAEAQLAKLEDEPADDQAGNEPDEATRSAIPAEAELRNATVVASFGGNVEMRNTENNMEYRNAFMEFVLRGTPIPMELRENANTTTGDVASVIPTQLVGQIIEKFDNVGMILPLINRTSYAAGVEIPTSSVKPVATWVAEGKGSDRQKKTTGTISFTYFKLRCEISMSMEVGTMALAAFEAKFVENVAKAMTYAIENAVINGTGTGQPKGILAEKGVAITGQATYAKLCEVEGAIPVEYETGSKWCMNKKTFMQFAAMTDQSGQPIARVNYGVGGKPERILLGRDVVISPYVADNKAFVFDFSDYVLNTIYDMGISKKQDWDTEDLLTKAVMSVDGKVVDAGSLVTFEITPAA